MTIWFDAPVSAQDQKPENGNINFRYSRNPKTRSKTDPPANAASTTEKSADIPDVQTVNAAAQPENTEVASPSNTSIARKTLEIAKKSATASIIPTEIYKVGAGDVLFINLQNAPKAGNYFTVLGDGTIDYPLTGEMLPVSGLTTDEIEDLLKSKIKLYENPQLAVKVRDYSSHTITVLGLVGKSGEIKIQREAVPLFVVKAETVVQPKADSATVRRANSMVETLDLKDAKTDDVLIFPGDIIEFAANEAAETVKTSSFYYIGGEIGNGGQKEFHSGITLSQAILASGGLKKQTVKKVVIRRKNSQGLLSSMEFNLKEIREGRQPDPVLQFDDIIEIGLP